MPDELWYSYKISYKPFKIENPDFQWWLFEDQQSTVYVVHCHFPRHPDRWWDCCHNLALLAHIDHIWELSNEAMYNLVPQGT